MSDKLLGVFSVKHKDENVVELSRSGGMFTAVSDYVLENKGVIYGCVLDGEFMAIHVRADDKTTRDRMRGSKYIQSRLGNCYSMVKEDLEKGKTVLFSGTSCQVDGLQRFLGRDYEKLLCIDVVCHGVSSPKAWNAYLKWIEKSNHSKIDKVDFRNKKLFGWRDHKESFYLQNGKTVHTENYRNLYLGDALLRPACYECHYKTINHPGDITIADNWGVEKAAPEFDDNKGTSLVLVNSEKGMKAFEAVKETILYKETDLKFSMQPALETPTRLPQNRASVWKSLNSLGMSYVVRRYGEYGMLADIKRAVKRFIRR